LAVMISISSDLVMRRALYRANASVLAADVFLEQITEARA
jgi:hypothetical protein